MRRARELEFTVGLAFLLGPMVYALTLPNAVQHCDVPAIVPASVEPPECPPAEVEVVIEAEPTRGPVLRPFMFVEGGKVILHTDAPAEWGRGELFEPRGEAPFRVARSADLDRLPGDLAAQVARSIDLQGPAGKLCSVTIDRLAVVAQYTGDGMADVFDGGFPYDEEGWPIGVSRETSRSLLWTTQSRWLVGELSDLSGCGGALWARDSDLPAPTILTDFEHEAFEVMKWGVHPITVFDADLDGQFERLYDVSDEAWARQLDSVTPSLSGLVRIEADVACGC